MKRPLVLAFALAAAVVPVACSAHPDQPKVVCLQNLDRLGQLLRRLEANGELKPLPGADYLLQVRAGLPERDSVFFQCPGDPDRDPARCSYRGPDAAFLARGAADRNSPEAAGQILACCACGDDGREPWHGDGVCVLHVKGVTEFIPYSEMEGYDGGPVPIGPDSPDPRFRHLVR